MSLGTTPEEVDYIPYRQDIALEEPMDFARMKTQLSDQTYTWTEGKVGRKETEQSPFALQGKFAYPKDLRSLSAAVGVASGPLDIEIPILQFVDSASAPHIRQDAEFVWGTSEPASL
jgi:hypothetical protein